MPSSRRATPAARDLLLALPPSASQSESDRSALLLARAHQECGDTRAALALYEIGPRMAGAEAQCRHAALLIAEARRGEALPLLVEVEKKAKKLDRFQRAQDGEMYDWAARTLKELRG